MIEKIDEEGHLPNRFWFVNLMKSISFHIGLILSWIWIWIHNFKDSFSQSELNWLFQKIDYIYFPSILLVFALYLSKKQLEHIEEIHKLQNSLWSDYLDSKEELDFIREMLDKVPWALTYKTTDWVYMRCSDFFYNKIWIKPEDIIWKTDNQLTWLAKRIAQINWVPITWARDIWDGIEEYEVKMSSTNWWETIILIRKTSILSSDWVKLWELCVWFNITEEKALQKQLKESLDFLQNLIDKIPYPIFFKGLDWKYIFCNKAFWDLFWVESDCIKNLSMNDVVSPEDTNLHMSNDAVLLAQSEWPNWNNLITYEAQILHKWLWSIRNYIISKTLMFDTSGQELWILWLVFDRTDRQKLRDMEKTVESIVRHEIWATLNWVLWMCSLLMDDTSNFTQDQILFLNSLYLSWKRLNNIKSMFSDIFKIEEWIYESIYRQFDLILILKEINDIMKVTVNLDLNIVFYYNWKKINLVPNLLEQFQIFWDERLFYHMFMNLIKNACEASKPWDEVRVDLNNNQECLEFSVKNTWVIPEEIRHRFFEKFVTVWKFNWTWLWAYFVRKIVKMMWWDIDFETSSENWTTFFIKLPIKVPEIVPN